MKVSAEDLEHAILLLKSEIQGYSGKISDLTVYEVMDD